MKQEKSCGGIVFRTINGKIEFLLVQQHEGGHRFFPKGHVEEGESEQDTTLREILEETGLRVKIIDGFRETFSYIDRTKDVGKTVVFFLCEIDSGDVSISDEIENYARLDYDRSLQTLTHDNSKAVLTKAYDFLSR